MLDLTSSAKAYSFTSSSAYDIPKAELAIKQSTDNPSAYRLCVDDVSLTGGAEPEVYRPDAGPRARVNQVAYLPGGPKAATLVTERTTPVTWALKIAAGKVVASGRTTPRGVDPSAGLNAHSIEFGRFNRRGTGYTLVADGETSYRFDTGTKAYEALRRDSKSFFYTQRCGIAIDDALVPGSRPPAGDSGVTPNKGDTAVPCQDLADDSQRLYDKPWTCDYTTDVSGGWYDAVDHGKYVSTVEFRWRS